MPYVSDKQRKFMHAVHPEIAKRWDKEMGKSKVKKSAVASAMEHRGK